MPQPNIDFASIGLRARERVDMVGSSFISPTEEETYIETAWKEFVLRCLERHDDVFLARRFVTTTIGSELVELQAFNPKDVMKVRAVQHYANSTPQDFLRRLDVREEMLVSSGQRGKPTHYFAQTVQQFGPQLRVFPTPDQVYTLRVAYFPFQSLRDYLAGGSGNFYSLAGWDEYLVLSVGIKMRDKEESDCSVLMAEKDQMFDLMMKTLAPFDEGEPAAVVQQRSPFQSIYDDPFAIEDRYGYG